MSDTKRYEDLFLNSSNEVAVMLRIEHVIDYVNKHREQSSIDKCLEEAYQLTKERQQSGRPMVTLDMGKFGSGVWSELTAKYDVAGLAEKSKQLLNSLFNNELSYTEWEESFTRATGGVENSGYIAALQRTLASRAKCLVLVGGGTFQDLALKDYLRNHPKREDQCVKLVCIYKNEELFRNIIHTT
jgi:Zn-dependent oligopeptidase